RPDPGTRGRRLPLTSAALKPRPWMRYLALSAVAIGACGLGLGLFAEPIGAVVGFSRLTTSVLGLVSCLVVVVPLNLFSLLAVEAVAPRTAPAVYPLVGAIIGIAAAPAGLLFWASGPVALAIAAPVVAAVAAVLLAGGRLPSRTGRGALTMAILFGLGLLVMLPSTASWLMFPFSAAFVFPAGLFLLTCGLTSLAGIALLSPPPREAADVRRRLLEATLFVVAVGLAADIALWSVLRARTRVVTHEMSWTNGGTPDPPSRWDRLLGRHPRPACEAKLLLLKEGCAALDHMVCSDEVTRYVESSGRRTVPVRYAVTDDFGRIGGYTIDRIGPLPVDIQSRDSIRKEEGVECVFHPGPVTP
ncbi:MAG TPA: hypothetical protein VFK70_09165, partial [Vicinamibacteria bacterium]|nr:hypothetical protein [Vicinamibacteria bacterium]